jgi:integrase
MGAVREDRVRTEFMRLTVQIALSDYTAPKMLRHLFATSLQEGRVDPLIRNELLGHVAQGAGTAGHGLAMTAVYTHTRPETRRQQLEAALAQRPAVVVAQTRLQRKASLPT